MEEDDVDDFLLSAGKYGAAAMLLSEDETVEDSRDGAEVGIGRVYLAIGDTQGLLGLARSI